jgi:hypothetical protein
MSPQRLEEEILVPFPAPRDRLAPATNVRTTLLVSSLRAIRQRGLQDVYAKAVDPAWRNALLQAVTGSWLPLAAGVAHYSACDAVVHMAMDQVAIGREVGDQLYKTFLGTMIRAATGVGVTPWVTFPYTPKMYERIFDGGGCCVTKLGPKEATMEMAANPLCAIGYFRNATRGVWTSALDLFCTKAYMREVARTETSFKVRISWA